MSLKAFQAKLAIEVDVIKTEKRKPAWKRAALAEIGPDVRFVQVRSHRGCHGAAHPFVEIAENDTRAAQVLVNDDTFLKELASLFSLFEKPRSEMNVKDMQRIVVEANIRAQASATLATSGTDVIVLMTLYRKSRQHDIAVATSLVPAILAEGKMKAKFARNESRLVLFP
jgi:hypothetical protein